MGLDKYLSGKAEVRVEPNSGKGELRVKPKVEPNAGWGDAFYISIKSSKTGVFPHLEYKLCLLKPLEVWPGVHIYRFPL